MIQKKKRTRVKNRDKSRDYVDGPTLHKNLLEWYESGANDPTPPLIIVKAITQIIHRLGTSGQFSGYSFLEEMKGDALVACYAALHGKKYNPYIENPNPFAYFTQIAWNAFINVINNEKKQSYIKHKSLMHHQQDMQLQGEDIEGASYENLDHDLIDKFEKKKIAKKPKKKKDDLGEFMEKENDE